MLQCWKLEAELRPAFSDLVMSVSKFLESMASYMDVSTFGENKSTVVDSSEPKAPDTAEFDGTNNLSEESMSHM